MSTPAQPCVVVDDRLDGKTRAELLERADEEGPGAFRVKPEIGPLRSQAASGALGADALGHDAACGVEHDDLHVGLADVEDRDAAVHGLSP